MNPTQGENWEYVHMFSVSQYNNTRWLMVSKVLNKLFCLRCLLLCNNNGMWSKIGFNNLNTPYSAVMRYEKSSNYIRSFLQLKTFGTTWIVQKQVQANLGKLLGKQKWISDSLHNEKNREIRKHLANDVCYFCLLYTSRCV